VTDGPLARRFPRGFVFGAATSAYQIEGAADADGKGPSIWDTFCRRPGAISTGETGDVACDAYGRWREDVDLMAGIGLGAYRFSVSWPRVQPAGTGAVNEAGLAYYERLVDALLERGIRPLLTLYHWDLPQALQDRGGWADPETVRAFAGYAELVARRLGDRVRDWITINEPQIVARLGHETGEHAPGIRDHATAVRVGHHLLLAHRDAAAAIRAASSRVRVGIALNLTPCEPASTSPGDEEAARRLDAGVNRWYLDPLFGRGYPREVLALEEEHLAGADLDGYDGALDFLGVNYYDRTLVRASPGARLGAVGVPDERAERTAMGWEVHPAALGRLLVRLHREYEPRALLVTENGAAYDDVVARGEVDDPRRRSYLEGHVAACAEATLRGAPLEGYFVWSLLDNFEWAHGTSKRFGIVHVDFATQRRRVKASGRWYRDLIAAHSQ
jgi:beta-glucosidase